MSAGCDCVSVVRFEALYRIRREARRNLIQAGAEIVFPRRV